MKLTKDQIQKIGLGAMMLVGVIYAYNEFLLSPLQQEQEVAKAALATLDPQVVAAKKQIAKTKTLEAKGPETDLLIKQVGDMIPEGAPVAWFPPKMTDFFKRQGIEKVAARMNNEFAEKDMPGFRRISWSLDVPGAEFVKLAAALSALENEEPLFEIHSVDVETNRESTQFQHITVNINSISRQ
jgi:hypothetical protein